MFTAAIYEAEKIPWYSTDINWVIGKKLEQEWIKYMGIYCTRQEWKMKIKRSRSMHHWIYSRKLNDSCRTERFHLVMNILNKCRTIDAVIYMDLYWRIVRWFEIDLDVIDALKYIEIYVIRSRDNGSEWVSMSERERIVWKCVKAIAFSRRNHKPTITYSMDEKLLYLNIIQIDRY